MSDPTTPNSPTLSRTVKARVSANEFSALLQRTVLDNPPTPVKLLLEEEGVSVWTHDAAKTIQLLIDRAEVGTLRVSEPCVLLVEPKSFAELLKSKFAGEVVEINTEAGQPITVNNRTGSTVTYHPADEDDCNAIPDHWVLPVDDGYRVFPMFDNEKATSRIAISTSELKKALVDMNIAKAPYVVFDFKAAGSTCQSGHWGSKSNRSTSPVSATIDGADTEVCFTENLTRILGCFDPRSEAIIIHKHEKGGFIVLEAHDHTPTTVVATEAIREV
jgi:hypothetical protein